MMKATITLKVILLFGLTACAQSDAPASEALSHPFIGCWDSADGSSRETWTQDPSGWLVGYSANRDKDGEVTFFEHMRIESDGPEQTLIVTGRDSSQTAFSRVDTESSEVYRFENPDHDFPQVITYEPTSGRLDAWISAIDASNRIEFKKAACKG